MLVLKRKEGQWVEVTHRSGDVLRIRVCKIEAGFPGHLNLAFDDDPRNFEIERPERQHEGSPAKVANLVVIDEWRAGLEQEVAANNRLDRVALSQKVARTYEALGIATLPLPEIGGVVILGETSVWGVPVQTNPDLPAIPMSFGNWGDFPEFGSES